MLRRCVFIPYFLFDLISKPDSVYRHRFCLYFCDMSLTDLIIIYLACGSPFGVYQITTSDKAVNSISVLLTGVRILVWPIFATLMLIDWLANRSSPGSEERQIDAIGLELEQLIFDDCPASFIFDFREVLKRYAGLAKAARQGVHSDAGGEFHDLSGNGHRELAAACLARKNQRKLLFQLSLVRREFVEVLSELLPNGSRRAQILELALELTKQVGDPVTSSELMRLRTHLDHNQLTALSTREYDVSVAN